MKPHLWMANGVWHCEQKGDPIPCAGMGETALEAYDGWLFMALQYGQAGVTDAVNARWLKTV